MIFELSLNSRWNLGREEGGTGKSRLKEQQGGPSRTGHSDLYRALALAGMEGPKPPTAAASKN